MSKRRIDEDGCPAGAFLMRVLLVWTEDLSRTEGSLRGKWAGHPPNIVAEHCFDHEGRVDRTNVAIDHLGRVFSRG